MPSLIDFIVDLNIKILSIYSRSKIFSFFTFPYYLLGLELSRVEGLITRSRLHFIATPIVYYYFKKYYSLFYKGKIVSAYKYKVRGIDLCSKILKGERRASALNYISLVNGDSSPLKGCFNKFPFEKKHEVIKIIGPKIDINDIKDNFNENDLVLVVKPYLVSKFRFKIFGYYNKIDFEKKESDIVKDYENGLVDGTFSHHVNRHIFSFPTVLMNNKFFSGSPVSLLHIINTFISFGFEKISLRGFDFYMGDSIYLDSYYSSLKNDSNRVDMNKFITSMATHDILFNYILLKEIVEAENIEVDHMLEYVRYTTATEYLKRFEEKYGVH